MSSLQDLVAMLGRGSGATPGEMARLWPDACAHAVTARSAEVTALLDALACGPSLERMIDADATWAWAWSWAANARALRRGLGPGMDPAVAALDVLWAARAWPLALHKPTELREAFTATGEHGPPAVLAALGATPPRSRAVTALAPVLQALHANRSDPVTLVDRLAAEPGAAGAWPIWRHLLGSSPAPHRALCTQAIVVQGDEGLVEVWTARHAVPGVGPCLVPDPRRAGFLTIEEDAPALLDALADAWTWSLAARSDDHDPTSLVTWWLVRSPGGHRSHPGAGPDAELRIGGPSIGLAAAMAFALGGTRGRPEPSVAYTGRVLPDGSVQGVGEIGHKHEIAAGAGVSYLIAPRQAGRDRIPDVIEVDSARAALIQTHAITRRRRLTATVRRLVVIGTAIALLVAGFLAMDTLFDQAPSPPEAYSFLPLLFPNRLLVTREWTLTGRRGTHLRSDLRVANLRDSSVTATVDEVIPKSVSPSVTHIGWHPAPGSIVRADPVVRYGVDSLAPGDQRLFSYDVGVAPKGTGRGRLEAMAADQVAAQDAYRREVGSEEAPQALARLDVEPSRLSLAVGETFRLQVSGTMSDGSPAPPEALAAFAWRSSSPSTVGVAGGMLTGLAPGGANITAQAGPLAATVDVTVAGPSSSVAAPGSGGSPGRTAATPEASTPRNTPGSPGARLPPRPGRAPPPGSRPGGAPPGRAPPPGPGGMPPQAANGRIAFSWTTTGGAGSAGATSDIWTINPDGSGRAQLTRSGTSAQNPAWSPDGARIAFDSGGAIVVTNADGSGWVTVATGGASQPAWSPDGSRLAFARGGIVVMNADGSGQTSLTSTGPGLQEDRPEWSPDGTRIVFNVSTGGGRGLMVMSADGSGQASLPCGACSDAAWSPDGSKIAYANGLAPAPGISVMNTDGTGQQQLAGNPTGQAGGAGAPAWSPDGTRIVFSASNGIWVMSARGGAETQLVGAAGAHAPAWQPVPLP